MILSVEGGRYLLVRPRRRGSTPPWGVVSLAVSPSTVFSACSASSSGGDTMPRERPIPGSSDRSRSLGLVVFACLDEVMICSFAMGSLRFKPDAAADLPFLAPSGRTRTATLCSGRRGTAIRSPARREHFAAAEVGAPSTSAEEKRRESSDLARQA
ncbi:hypothetical protein RHECNPAF_2190018 [Rhizobium etli CNPAF512]|nr:hypothetical protein RHECNPAF_2190018 [Rhizobium etli CNPAF512]